MQLISEQFYKCVADMPVGCIIPFRKSVLGRLLNGNWFVDREGTRVVLNQVFALDN